MQRDSGRSADSSVVDCSLPLSVSEDELRTELTLLGFPDVPRHRLLQFKVELEQLMKSRSESSGGEKDRSPLVDGSLDWAGEESGSPLVDGSSDSAGEESASPLADGSSDSAGEESGSSLVDGVSHWRIHPLGPYRQRSVSVGGNGSGRAAITRKVLRKRSNGQVEVCDESTLSSDERSLCSTEERRQSLTGDSVKSFIRVPPYSLLEQYRHHSDPVGRYHQYKQSWDTLQRALDGSRKDLRWGIRERMMSAPPAPLPRHLPAPPNSYVIPTEKKRYGLRWAIRQDLVNGHVPRASHS